MTGVEVRRGCTSAGFKALLFTQFCGALNDNLFKTLVALLVVNQLVAAGSSGGQLAWVNFVFVLPFLLLSPFAGYLADRFPKSLVLKWAKLLEVAVMTAALLCFFQQSVAGLIVVLFFMGLQSAIFSPSKYGILPEILEEHELSRGNGYLEFWTFAAIIAGTAIAGLVKAFSAASYVAPGILVVLIAVVGFVASLRITQTLSAGLDEPMRISPLQTIAVLRQLRKQRGIFLSVLGIAFFWALGAFYQLNIFLYAKQQLLADDTGTALLVTALGLGIGVGSVIAGIVSQGKVELGLVPIGGALLTISSVALLTVADSYSGALFWFIVSGVGGGFFIVPLDAYLQEFSPTQERGRYIAASNVVSYVGILLASALLWFGKDVLGADPAVLFAAVGFVTLLVTIYLCRLLPEMLVRCANWLLAHSLYRLQVLGAENVPRAGGALLVSNHVSFADAALLLASIQRPVRFLMYRPIYEAPLVNFFARTMGSIPVATEDGVKSVVAALEQAREAVRQGDLVCIFAEGSLTRIGHMLAFQRGLERIMKNTEAPVIPVFLDKLWGSIFSYRDGRFFWKVPKQIPYPVTVSFGRALPSTAKAFEVRQAVEEVAANAARQRSVEAQVLPRAFLAVAKRHPFRRAVSDSMGISLRYGTLLSVVLFLSQYFRERTEQRERIGVLLPSSAGAVFANLASVCAGIVPINLNFTLGREQVELALERSQCECIVTSRAFLERIGWQDDGRMIFIEEVLQTLSTGRRLLYAFCAYCVPKGVLEQAFLRLPTGNDELATILFSSGSTSEPKGVMLSHANIASNIEGLYDVFQVVRSDVVMGILPFFHSFGFTGTLWFPLLSGIHAVYHPNPLDSAVIGRLVEEHRATILMSTPTFLLGFIRKCTREQFESLRTVVVGAEKLKESLRQAFAEKFGVSPLEGYGCTELSPVAVINVNDVQEGRVNQVGNKPGTVGHTLPGVASRIVDLESGAILPPNQEGLLLVSGPNVMLGYLNNPEKTAEVISDGWYTTGDIARKDEDGFITITDRLSRFSKIAGEMVPHGKVEEVLQRELGSAAQCAVTAVEDQKKGERLVVLHTGTIDAAKVLESVRQKGELPNLWIPRADSFIQVEEIPHLASGKVNLRELKRLAIAELGEE